MYPTSVNELVAKATDSAGITAIAGTTRQSFLTTILLIVTESAAP
jgi:hypothetical protein